jgi:hypothetical protein
MEVSGVRCQVSGKENKKLKPVEDPVCSKAAAGSKKIEVLVFLKTLCAMRYALCALTWP